MGHYAVVVLTGGPFDGIILEQGEYVGPHVALNKALEDVIVDGVGRYTGGEVKMNPTLENAKKVLNDEFYISDPTIVVYPLMDGPEGRKLRYMAEDLMLDDADQEESEVVGE